MGKKAPRLSQRLAVGKTRREPLYGEALGDAPRAITTPGTA